MNRTLTVAKNWIREERLGRPKAPVAEGDPSAFSTGEPTGLVPGGPGDKGDPDALLADPRLDRPGQIV